VPQGYCAIRHPSLFSHGGSTTYTGMCLDIAQCISYASADCPAPGTPVDNNAKTVLGCSGILPSADFRKGCNFTT
jgi:hypothetical protein